MIGKVFEISGCDGPFVIIGVSEDSIEYRTISKSGRHYIMTPKRFESKEIFWYSKETHPEYYL